MNEAIIVIGLGFGDEGKGATVDYLTRRTGAHTVVRFNGGAQAAHNVVTPDGRHHTFSQFGSGMFVPGTRTLLSRFMLVNPGSMLREELRLREVGIRDAWSRTIIDAEALVTTPFHIAANQLREQARGTAAHGTCGMGIGETMQDFIADPDTALRVKHLSLPGRAAELLDISRRRKREEFDSPLFDDVVFQRALKRFAEFSEVAQVRFLPERYSDLWGEGTVIFEGAQGVLLDEHVGLPPHTTWSKTTTANAWELLNGFTGRISRIGVTRAYMTRHGAGPLVTERPELSFPEPHNRNDSLQGKFRFGHLDLGALSYAILSSPVDEVAINHLDQVTYPIKASCALHRNPARDEILSGRAPRSTLEIPDVDALVQDVESALGTSVTICGYGPTANDRRPR